MRKIIGRVRNLKRAWHEITDIGKTLTVVGFLVLLLLVNISINVLKASAELWVLRDNAKFYNSQVVKTTDMTMWYNEDMERRQELYNSDNVIVRIMCNSNTIVKYIIIFIAIAIILSPFWLIFKINALITEKEKRRFDRQQRAYRVREPDWEYLEVEAFCQEHGFHALAPFDFWKKNSGFD